MPRQDAGNQSRSNEEPPVGQSRRASRAFLHPAAGIGASIRRYRGKVAKTWPRPGWPASADTKADAILRRSRWPFAGRCGLHLSNRTVAGSLGAMKPYAWHGMGADGCTMISPARQANFSRAVSITLQSRDHLQCLGHVLAQLRQRRRPAIRAARRNGEVTLARSTPRVRRSERRTHADAASPRRCIAAARP